MNTRHFFLVNSVADLRPGMTTLRLITVSAGMGVETLVIELGRFGVDTRGTPIAASRIVSGTEEDLAGLAETPPNRAEFTDNDTVFVRLNPARFGNPDQIDFTLWMLDLLERNGVTVINTPQSLQRTATKAFLSELPEALRPRQAIAADIAAALDVIDGFDGEVVAKPVRGTRGEGVTFIDKNLKNLRSKLQDLVAKGPVVIQECIHTPDHADKRFIVVDGRLLTVGGQDVAIRRVPAAGERRSNVHLGARIELTHADERELTLIEELGPYLLKEGLRVAGVDVLDGRVLELNVWSPGGPAAVEKRTGLDTSGGLLRQLIGRAT
ncbi:MAG: hypothetical protein OER80_14795 [Gammaproteobacteria bacterium]|nr:hypothetical protein [Gammaproteobacteria bacterium]MDH3768363.1 hypothetical protein [Gammaproteobacteria bacterium]